MKTFGLIIIAALCIYGFLQWVDSVATVEKCPVTGSPVDKEIFVDYQGERIYFSNKQSLERFNKNPDMFLQSRVPSCASG